MSIVGASPAEKEESGQRKREDFTEREGSGLENPEKKALSISTRLRRQISGVISALASLTKSGRLARVVINEHEQDDLEDSREIVALSLEAFAEGLQCIGGMAESLKNHAAANERNPFQLVVQIIDHTTRGMFDHPFFREASIGPRDTIMIEEAENAIMVHVRGSQGYQKVPCAALFIIPEDLKPFLDEVVTMWSHFFGKEYDIACFYEREVFEKLEDLKERAKPLNRLFGGMIRAFDDAIDVTRAEYARSLERFTDTRTEQEPLLEEEIPDIEPLPAKKTHGISQPFFPPPSLEQVYEELQPSEQRLMEMDPQFDEMIQELLSDLRSMLRGEKPRQTTHFADRLPEPTEQEHQGLDRVYRQLVPGSILHLLNPRTFLLMLLKKGIEEAKQKKGWDPAEYQRKSLREVLVEINPGTLFLKQLEELQEKDPAHSEEDSAADIHKQFGRLAELAASAIFPRANSLAGIATSEILCHEDFIRPGNPFSFMKRIAASPILRGEKPSSEDKLCRLFIGLVEAMRGKNGSIPGGIAGTFLRITGNVRESSRWIKTESTDKPLMEARCTWLQEVFETSFQEDEIRILGKAVFGFLQVKTKQQWDGNRQGRSLFKLVQHQAKAISWDEEEVKAFCQAYDAAFKGLEQTIGDLLESGSTEQDLSHVAWSIHAYWHKSLLALLPIVTGLLRADTRLRGQLAGIGSIRSLELSGLNGPQVISYLRTAEEQGKIVLPAVGKDGVNPYFLTVRQKRKPAGSP